MKEKGRAMVSLIDKWRNERGYPLFATVTSDTMARAEAEGRDCDKLELYKEIMGLDNNQMRELEKHGDITETFNAWAELRIIVQVHLGLDWGIDTCGIIGLDD